MSAHTSSASHWGIDLGGTKIEGIVLGEESQPIARLRVATEAAQGYEHVVGRIAEVVSLLEAETKLSRPALLGIGTPGTTDPFTGLIKNSNTVCLNGRPLITDIEKNLGLNIIADNDANCCALAEATLGAGRGHRVVVGLILGTGVGSGIVVNGHLISGLHGIAGEWGHNPMTEETTPCYCGRRGCVETVISGTGLARYYNERAGTNCTLPQIVEAAERGDDPIAAETLLRLREKFAQAIAAYINILDPDAIIVGGGVGNIPILYSEETRRAIEAHLFNPVLRTPILRPTLGDSAGVFGAAMLTNRD